MTTRQRRSREDVLEAAGRLFAERGYHGTSMRDLGRELGVLGSSLYSHVGGKEELLMEVIRRGAAAFQALVDEVSALEEGPIEQLRRLIDGHVEIVTGDLHQASVFLNEARFLSADERREVLELRDQYEAAFREVLSRGVAEGAFRSDLDVALAGIAILSILNAITRWYRPGGRKTPSEVGSFLFEFVQQGLA